MDMLIGLINSLKLDETLFYQFVVFMVGYYFLYYVLFKPYNNAAQIRYQRTTGSEESADKFDEEIELLSRKYGEKVKETNEAISSIFSDSEEKTKKEASAVMLEAQSKYKSEKDQREQVLNTQYKAEEAKVPELTKDLKAQLKKVLAGGVMKNIFTFFFLTLLSTQALAAEGSIPWAFLKLQVANFVVFAILIVILSRSKIAPVFKAIKDEYIKKSQEAKLKLESAEKKRDDLVHKILKLEEERSASLVKAKEQAEAKYKAKMLQIKDSVSALNKDLEGQITWA